MFAYQKYGVKPDVITTAKALGCGVPIGAFAMTEKVGQNSLKAGDHGTTYGGNPLACAAASKVFDMFESMEILKNVRETGDYLYEKLEMLYNEKTDIIAHRGVGFIQGLEFDHPVGDIIAKALEKGLVLINAGTNIIRFVPPLIVSKADVDAMLDILTECL